MLLSKAQEYATLAHAGQKRKFSGEDYINHPLRVRDRINYMLVNYGDGASNLDYKITLIVKESIIDSELSYADFNKLIQIIALNHDVMEDAADKGFNVDDLINHLGESLKEINIDTQPLFLLKLRVALRKLTHSKDTSYKNYILDIKSYPLARLVKIADIMDNRSNLKPGAQKDKYELALHILLN